MFIGSFVWVWGSVSESRDEVHVLHDFRSNEDLKIGLIGSSIPIIGNVSSVHDFSEKISKIVIRNDFVVTQIIVEHIGTDVKISIIEVISSRPTLRSELLSSENKGVENTESE